MYVFQIFDTYAASRSLLFVGLFEIIAISYVYGNGVKLSLRSIFNIFFSCIGINRFYDHLQKMWRINLGPWLKIMWAFVTPVYTVVSLTKLFAAV
jgi:hypothetical protein